MTGTALELATVDALIDELAKRYDHLILCGMQIRTTGERLDKNVSWRRFGDEGLGVFLAEYVKDQVLRRIEDHIEPIEPGEL